MTQSPVPVQHAGSPFKSMERPPNPLLPAFEPFSSSPILPRPAKRSRDAFEENPTYPTPVPTSSTALMTSSPPRQPLRQPLLQRSLSTLSERVPLTSRPSIELDVDGKPTRLGRSSVSCDYQLSANRLISRVHVEAKFRAATSSLERDRVEILCSGWNGLKIHCQGKIYELKKGERFSSDIRDAEIMLDVHDSRVVLQWPDKPHLGPNSSDEESVGSPLKRPRAMIRHSTPPSPSPAQLRKRLISPISPSPAVQALFPSSPPVMPALQVSGPVEIYEDPESAEDQEELQDSVEISQPTQIMSQKTASAPVSFETSTPLNTSYDFSDNDEENDPIVHSFGPFGANLLPRMASFNTSNSPRPGRNAAGAQTGHAEPLQHNPSPLQPKIQPIDFEVQEHVINQLAFSRLSSTPLSTIWTHLPREEAQNLTKEDLKNILIETRCIGEVVRAGKDAAGKKLESEYYYIPDNDEDERRKEAVVNDLQKPGLRACRKQHKQYYWRKPK